MRIAQESIYNKKRKSLMDVQFLKIHPFLKEKVKYMQFGDSKMREKMDKPRVSINGSSGACYVKKINGKLVCPSFRLINSKDKITVDKIEHDIKKLGQQKAELIEKQFMTWELLPFSIVLEKVIKDKKERFPDTDIQKFRDRVTLSLKQQGLMMESQDAQELHDAFGATE